MKKERTLLLSKFPPGRLRDCLERQKKRGKQKKKGKEATLIPTRLLLYKDLASHQEMGNEKGRGGKGGNRLFYTHHYYSAITHRGVSLKGKRKGREEKKKGEDDWDASFFLFPSPAKRKGKKKERASPAELGRKKRGGQREILSDWDPLSLPLQRGGEKKKKKGKEKNVLSP